MHLKIKDIGSSAVYTIDESGVVIGRGVSPPDLRVVDDSISKRHARIFFQNNDWFIEDLASSNGTYFRGNRLEQPMLLSAGVIISLAQRKFQVLSIEYGNDQKTVPPTTDAGPSSQPRSILFLIPVALRFYLIRVAKLIFLPNRALQQSAQLYTHPTLVGTQLAIYGLVAGILVALVSISFGMLKFGLVGFGPFMGIMTHRWLARVVVYFGGYSSAQSRTNFVLDCFSYYILVAVASEISVRLSQVDVWLAEFSPLIVGALVGLLGVYILLQWSVSFELSGRFRLFVAVFSSSLLIVGTLSMAVRYVDINKLNLRGIRNISLPMLSAASNIRSDALVMQTRVIPNNIDIGETTEELAVNTELMQDCAPSSALMCCMDSLLPNSENKTETSEHEGVGYKAFAYKRDYIEKIIDDNPGLLNRKHIAKIYAAIWKKTYEIRERWSATTADRPRWEREKILAQKQKYEVFKKTRKEVERLFSILESGRWERH